MDARITVEAPDNTRGVAEVTLRAPGADEESGGAVLPPDDGGRDPLGRLPVPDQRATPRRRACPLTAFEDYFYGACLRDWDAESESMHRLLARFDDADQVHIVGDETDLTLSLRGPQGRSGRRPREHARRRVLLLAASRTPPRGRSLRRPDRCSTAAPVSGIRLTLPQGTRRRGVGGAGRGRARWPRSTSTRAPASSASSGSAATPASRGRCETSSTTRRWPGRSTSPWARATRRSVGRTSAPFTGT